jgi:hypothetical protein
LERLHRSRRSERLGIPEQVDIAGKDLGEHAIIFIAMKAN